MDRCVLVTFLLAANLTGESVTQCITVSWSEFEGYCYLALRTRLNFFLAQDTCYQIGANLTSVHSPEEYTYITMMNVGDMDFWVGLRRESGEYRWTDGTSLSHWTEDLLNRDSRRSDCAAVIGQTFVTRPCDKHYLYICKRPVEASTTVPTSTTTTSTTSASSPTATTTTTIELSTTRDILENLVWVRKQSETASIPDNRPSAVGIGAFGVFIMAAILVTVFLMDIGTFFKHFRWMRGNLKQCWRRQNAPDVVDCSGDDRSELKRS